MKYLNRNSNYKTSDFVLEIIMVLLAALVMVPIYYLLVTTFKTPEEATFSPLGLPSNFTLENYINAWTKMDFPLKFCNNLIIAIGSVTGIIILSSMAAYVIARRPNKLNKVIFYVFLSGIMVPFQMAIIPLYKLVGTLNLFDNLFGVIIILIFAVNLPFSIFLFRGFVKTIPYELEESAMIDGCGVFRTFCVIVFPLMKPVIATVAILDSLSIWNDFLTPLLFLQTREKQVILQEVYRNIGQFQTDWTAFFPMMVLGVAPLLVFYLFMQKYIIEGIVSGSVKG